MKPACPASDLRSIPWKLIEYYENGAAELYNLDSDAGEQRDITLFQSQSSGQVINPHVSFYQYCQLGE
jgi:hypothetical protein